VRLLLIAILLLIVYGTLYPFRFDFDRTLESPARILFHSWPDRFDRFAFRDVVTNIFLYAPLGFVATLVFARRWWAAVLLGAALSAGVEMLQVYDATRTCSLADLICNIGGSAAGAAIAMAAPRRYHTRVLDRTRIGPLIVVSCWAAYLLYPFVPLLSRGHLHASWTSFLAAPMSPAEIAANTAEWLAAALLVEPVVGRLRAGWIALALCALPLRLLLADRNLAPPEVCGAVLAVVLWVAIPPRLRTRTGTTLMAVAILLRELAPFHFASESHPFSWIPFAATLSADRVPATVVIFRKAFDYGVMIWLARPIGLIRAGGIVAAALFILEWAQRYLPARQPEITDAVLALLMGALLAWVRK
jgi:VanZ family protein